MKNNNLLEMQEMLFAEMKRLSDDKLMEEKGMEEVARSNALSASALTILKSINAQLRIEEVSQKYEINEKVLHKKIGLMYDDEA